MAILGKEMAFLSQPNPIKHLSQIDARIHLDDAASTLFAIMMESLR